VQDAASLTAGLSANRGLVALHLTHLHLGDKVTSAIANGLAQNRHLTKLVLAGNHIADEGAAAIFSALVKVQLWRLGCFGVMLSRCGRLIHLCVCVCICLCVCVCVCVCVCAMRSVCICHVFFLAG
jgi:hypothetical protein